jgi:hypothetical protein
MFACVARSEQLEAVRLKHLKKTNPSDPSGRKQSTENPNEEKSTRQPSNLALSLHLARKAG